MFGFRKKIEINDFIISLNARFNWKIFGEYKNPNKPQPYLDLKDKLSSLKKSKLKIAVNEIYKDKKLIFLNHLKCIEFMTMMAGYKDFAKDTYMTGNIGITPVVYLEGKDWIINQQIDVKNDHSEITEYDKYYEKLILTKKRYKPTYGGYEYRYILSDEFIEPSINILNEIFFNNLLDANEIDILNEYFFWSYEYWSNEFKKIRLYHSNPTNWSGSGSSEFDIGAM